ncbi:hypothetical protein BIT28_25760 [Photobacterium proteolyticum]|uniref:Uncharacterized protein n=1 Tax=Photobacterium proteolyticum TaxID=1903952 RepID=A0A1Q9H1V9_9GAMM|nr:hypothetical protein BIT28_25760 [Photobacterium proteolyticum]
MIRSYALFSQKYKKSHYFIVSALLLAIVGSIIMLLSEEKIIFSIGLVLPALPFIIIARASDYKRKYLND